MRAASCAGFSCWKALALGIQAGVVGASGFSSCSLWTLEHRLNSCGAQV